MDGDHGLPRVSVVVPARNEAEFIERCVRHTLACDYPPDRLEVVVVDGMSDDGTADIVRRMAAEDGRVRLVENPRRITPVAFNLGIEAARGDVIFFLSGHSFPAADYFCRCVRVFQEHPEVWCVGGADVTVGENAIGRVIAAAMSSPVGVGNSRFRLGNYSGYVDTLTGGYWRWVFEKIGLFDEELIRNQDDELNFRVRQAGGRIWLDSDAKCVYYARGSFRRLARQYFQYGFWRTRTIQKHRQPAALRQIAPVAFVVTCLGLVLGTLVWPPIGYALAGLALVYGAALAYGVFDVARKAGLRLAPLAPVAFVLLHFGYGVGSLVGLWVFVVLRRGGTVDAVKYPMSR